MGEYERRKSKGEETGQAIKRTTFYYVKRFLFGGYLITVLLLLAQIAGIGVVCFLLDEYARVLLEGSTIFGVIIMIIIITSDKATPETKLSWSVIIALFPIGGALLYLYVKFNVGTIRSRSVLRNIIEETERYICNEGVAQAVLMSDKTDVTKLVKYMTAQGHTNTYSELSTEYYKLGDDIFEPLCADLEAAEQFIFLEFFMIEEGVFWNRILSILEKKAAAGVCVRVMYDDLGCSTLLKRNYPKELIRLGINVRTAGKITPFMSTRYNNRDHRKILVVDGKVAYTGGFNLCDEYINVYEKYGHWKDNGIRVTGDAVKQFTMMFLQMWNATGEWRARYSRDLWRNIEQDLIKYVGSGGECKIAAETSGLLIPYTDGPHQQEAIAKYVYKDIINNATRYVWIMSPYLILDHAMETLLLHAAKSGIDVRLVLPHIPDKKIPFKIAQSYYPTLLEAGVGIYEYNPGFVHAKTVISDDRIATVGTVNLDYRSLYLHYENGCVLYDVPCIERIKEDFEETFSRCLSVDLKYYGSISPLDRLFGRVMRLFGPLM